MQPSAPIAIVGMGGVFPGAPDLDAFWHNIVARRDATRAVPPGRWILDPAEVVDGRGGPDRAYSDRGCFIEGFQFDATGLALAGALLEGLDPMYELVLHAGRQAWQDAATQALDRDRVGVVLAAIALPTDASSAITRATLGRSFARRLFAAAGGRAAPALAAVCGSRGPSVPPLNARVTALPAGLLSAALGLGGGAFTLDAACASSLYAIKLACDELRRGRCDAMLAGGVSRPEALYTQIGFSQLQALSPSGKCRPFDARADGLVVGEGAGLVLLKRLDDALRDGDRIYGVIRGIGLSNDLAGSLLAADSEGQVRAMRAAYEQAGWSPADIDLIECHGTGTPQGDATELRSLAALWDGCDRRPAQCAIGSVKSNVGHLLTAAGAASLIKVLLALRARRLPPTANFQHPAPGLATARSPFRVQAQDAPWQRRDSRTPRRAAISAFGFGGINAHLLLEEWDPQLARAEGTMTAGTRRSRAPSPASGGVRHAHPSAPPPIAIVGLALHVGAIDSLPAFCELMFSGGSAIRERPARRWRGCEDVAAEWLGQRPMPGAYVDAIAVEVGEFHLPPSEIPEILPQQLLILQVVARALADAGMAARQRRPRSGAIIGMGLDLNTSNYHLRWSLLNDARRWSRELGLRLTDAEFAAWVRSLREAAGPPLNANRVMGALGNIVASRVAREFCFGGPSFAVSAEEAAGLRALDAAVALLQQGELDAAVAGAVDLAGDVRAVVTRHALRPYSAGTAARPFDAAADGTVVGEGAVALVLKRLADAVADGDRVYAVVRGVGFAGGDAPAQPRARTYRLALQRACAEAAVEAHTIAYVEAHGSGDPVEDQVEAEALAATFGGAAHASLVIGSAKAGLGHTGAAAGLLGIARAALCLHSRTLPPSTVGRAPAVSAPRSCDPLGFRPRHPSAPPAHGQHARPDSACAAGPPDALFELPQTRREWVAPSDRVPRRAAVGAIALDGNCAWAVLEEAPPECATHARRQSAGDGSVAGRRTLQRPQIVVPTGAPPPEPKWPERAAYAEGASRSAAGRDAPCGAVPQAAWLSELAAAVARSSAATARAHEAYLSFARTAARGMQTLKEWTARCRAAGAPAGHPQEEATCPTVAYTRQMCLEFAVGSVARVLGPEFAEVDRYPVRVRLPAEPLMLVDRILSVSGTKGGLGSGTIVTEHDVRPDAWYLDGGRAPVCIALEAGQADLFLCSYLGIDLAVKGRRVYRLLDATVRFDRGLPRPGETIRYEITIDRFLRQGETWLFFFRFAGTIAGQPLITMTDGCAGFFTPEEIEHSGGIVLTAGETRPQAGLRPADRPQLAALAAEACDERQLAALRAGDLSGCFGPQFAALGLSDPLRLPDGRLRLLHRVRQLDPTGGRWGLGRIVTETDIRPDDWFLTCHFIDDMVMPGTLMYECCHQALRVLLLRMGWVGEQSQACFEPCPGVAGKLRCRGPVTPATRLLTCDVELKELGCGREPYALADAFMYADGKRIVRFTDMSLKLSGVTRGQLEELWQTGAQPPAPQHGRPGAARAALPAR